MSWCYSVPEWVPGVDFELNYIRISLQGCALVWVPVSLGSVPEVGAGVVPP